MPNSYNKHDFDEQFTDSAWMDMKGRLDKALPVKKPFFLMKWFTLAAVFCLFCLGAYWFTSDNTELALNNTNSSITNESVGNKTNTSYSSVPSKSNLTTKQPIKNQATESKQSNTKNIQHLTPEKIESVLIAENKNVQATAGSNVTKNKKYSFSNVRPTSLKSKDINTISKNTNTSKTKSDLSLTQMKIQQKANFHLNKDEVFEHKNTINQKHNNQKLNVATYTKRIDNVIEHTKNLVTIDGNLHPSPKLIENTLIVNRSSAGQIKRRKLVTQKNDDEWLYPKTIQYGIKQGLSSDLTSESKICTGALVDFNFGKRYFVEVAPSYQFRVINKTLEAQYDVVTSTSISIDGAPDDSDEPDNGTSVELGESPSPTNSDPPIEPERTYNHSKDTILNTLNTNSHNLAADLLLGYRISPKVETLLGISVSRCFANCPKNLNDNLNTTNELFDSGLLYNHWTISPKFALRFALKPQLSVQASYAYNLVPTIKEEFQLENMKSLSSTSNNYRSSNFGLAFVYKFN